jgi:hypothetical protein
MSELVETSALRAPITTALAITAILAGCASSLPERQVDSSFTSSAFNWTSGGGGIYFSIKTFKDQGKVGLCGVYSAHSETDPQGRFEELGLAAIYVKLGTKIISYDAAFFNRVAFQKDTAPVGMASCKRTNVDWEPHYDQMRPQLVAGKKNFTVYD